MKKREEMCMGALGIFLCFLRIGWTFGMFKIAKRRVKRVINKFASFGYAFIDMFDWLSTGRKEHKHLNKKTPWKYLKLKKKYDFKKPNKKYWKIYNAINEIVYESGMNVRHQFSMERYNYYPFKLENNVNGVDGYWSEEAFKVLKADFRERLTRLKKIYGKRFKRLIHKFMNEPLHGGSDAEFHKIALWHRRMFEEVLIDFYDSKEDALSHLLIDTSTSEAGQLLLVWHGGDENDQICPKCKRLLTDIFGEKYKTEPWMDRLRISEPHNISILPDLESGYNSISAFFNSANIRINLHEDAGSLNCDQIDSENGYWFYDLCFASPEQYGQMCEHVWKMQMLLGNRKKCFITLFTVQSLEVKDGIILENYSMKRLRRLKVFEKCQAQLNAHKKVFGE